MDGLAGWQTGGEEEGEGRRAGRRHIDQAVLAMLAAVGGVLMFWRKKSSDDESPPPPPE